MTLQPLSLPSSAAALCFCYKCSSGAGHCHHQTSHVLLSTVAGDFPSFAFRIADTPSSQSTDEFVLSLTSPLPGWAGWLAQRPRSTGRSVGSRSLCFCCSKAHGRGSGETTDCEEHAVFFMIREYHVFSPRALSSTQGNEERIV